jgi:hypothetical protein
VYNLSSQQVREDAGDEKDVRGLLRIAAGELDRAAETLFGTRNIVEERERRTGVESLSGVRTTFTVWLRVPKDAGEGEN